MKSLANHFLLPLFGDDESYFAGSLTYICIHGESGASGLVVNRLLDFDVNRILEPMKIKRRLKSAPRVYEGGPVETGAPSILHTDDVMLDISLSIGDGLGLSLPTDFEIFKTMLEKIASGHGPNKFLVMLGYAGWQAGQLEDEINDNMWLTCPASNEVLFEVPVQNRAKQVAKSIGIDLNLLTGNPDGIA